MAQAATIAIIVPTACPAFMWMMNPVTAKQIVVVSWNQ